MAFTKKTNLVWNAGAMTAEAVKYFSVFQTARDAQVALMVAAGKTDTDSVTVTTVDDIVHASRNWVDAASAQEFLDMVESLATTFKLEQRIVSTEIVDI